MAPTRKDYASLDKLLKRPAQKSKFLNKVKDGRVGQVRTKIDEGGRGNRNAGKELFADNLHEATPAFAKKRGGSRKGRGRSSQPDPRSLARQKKTIDELNAEMDAYWSEHNNDTASNVQQAVQETSATLPEPISGHQLQITSNSNAKNNTKNKEITNAGKNPPRSFRSKLPPSKLATYKIYLRTFNTTALKINQINNQITKRVSLLSSTPPPYSHPILDIRNAQTTTTDTNITTSILSNIIIRRLNIWFALTLHAATSTSTPAFAPLRIFNLSITKFSDPVSLARLILHDPVMAEAGTSVGINTRGADVAVVGFEVCFPGDVTVGVPRQEQQQEESVRGEGEVAKLIQVQIQAGRKALVNTPCVLRCWFEQVHALVADVYGDVAGLVVVGHVDRLETEAKYGGPRRIVSFDTEWRSQEERYWLGRERVLGLQGQGHRDIDEEEDMKIRMREIEQGATRGANDMEEQRSEEEVLPFGHAELLDDGYLMDLNQNGVGYGDEHSMTEPGYGEGYEEYLNRTRY